MNLWLIFLTGLTTGGLSCLAMQGGLLASVIANQKKQAASGDILPVAMFLSAKFAIHVFLGFLLGLLGSVITLSLGIRLTFQVFTALFMLATAANLLNLHPIFRFVVFQPPKFLNRLIRKSSRNETLFAPAVLGLMTIFIPCGVTQAMEVLAINSGKPLYGAAIMGAFVLGTSPLFTLIGVATAKLSGKFQQAFAYLASFVLVGMSLFYLNGVKNVLGSPVTASGTVRGSSVSVDPNVIQNNGKQEVILEIMSSGYFPREFTVKSGIPVELTLKSSGAYSCASSFTFTKFNIFKQLKPVDSQTVSFTPTEKGSFRFSCSMGMYTGLMHVI